MDFAAKISNIRKEMHLSQEKFGELANVSQRTVAAWESGDRLPSLFTLDELADTLHTTTDNLLGRHDRINEDLAQFTVLASQLPDRDRETVLALMKIMAEQNRKGEEV